MAHYNTDRLKLIAVTGPTGAGKSTFINHVCGSDLKVGTGLRSCTAEIDVASCIMDDNKVTVLIDTPGFDDTTRSQADVLEDIGGFLKRTYEEGVKLAGVIYVHRISDRRVGGIARENFRLFRSICGEDAMRNVFIVTTMWEDVPEAVGDAREHELRTKPIFFQPAVDAGAQMLRHWNNAESARSIVRKLIEHSARTLQMQRELVDERKRVPDTSAGRDLSTLLEEQEKRHREEMQKLKEDLKKAGKDNEEIRNLKKELEKTKQELQRIKKDQGKLRPREGIRNLLRAGYRVEVRVLLCWKVYRIMEQ